MKVPHRVAVLRALRAVRLATKNSLTGLNKVAGQRMAKGDYAGAEALAAKGREIASFRTQVDELARNWRQVTARAGRPAKTAVGEVTPLWGYYQPVLRAIVAAGGECRREAIEAVIEATPDLLKAGDRVVMSGGRPRWKVMIRRARKQLRAEGWLEDEVAKDWRITAAGRKVAEAGTGRTTGR